MSDQIQQVIQDKILEAVRRPVPEFTRRAVLLPTLRNKAMCVIGMRRSGKTTFLHQCRTDQLARKIQGEQLIYFNFEDERLGDLTAARLSIIPDTQARLFPEAGGDTTFFFDEIQRVPGWEVFVRRLLDTPGCAVFVSGSSAKLLSREIATSMRGRGWEIAIYPFSFPEFLTHHGKEAPERADRLTSRQAAALDHYFLRYLKEGGFPEAQGMTVTDRTELLQGYVDVVLMRDIIERHGIVNVVALRQLVRRLLGSPAGLFSVQKFFADLKSQHVPVSRETIHALLDHLEDAFLLRTVPVATDSVKRRNVNPRKCYPIDPALIHAFDRSGRPNTGHSLETAVLVELLRRKCEAGYVRTSSGLEVDFLARSPAGESSLIQVCANVDDPATLTREIRALQEALTEHPRASPLILTAESRLPFPAVPKGVRILPAWQWMMEAP